jgi:hypothetical protein
VLLGAAVVVACVDTPFLQAIGLALSSTPVTKYTIPGSQRTAFQDHLLVYNFSASSSKKFLTGTFNIPPVMVCSVQNWASPHGQLAYAGVNLIGRHLEPREFGSAGSGEV